MQHDQSDKATLEVALFEDSTADGNASHDTSANSKHQSDAMSDIHSLFADDDFLKQFDESTSEREALKENPALSASNPSIAPHLPNAVRADEQTSTQSTNTKSTSTQSTSTQSTSTQSTKTLPLAGSTKNDDTIFDFDSFSFEDIETPPTSNSAVLSATSIDTSTPEQKTTQEKTSQSLHDKKPTKKITDNDTDITNSNNNSNNSNIETFEFDFSEDTLDELEKPQNNLQEKSITKEEPVLANNETRPAKNNVPESINTTQKNTSEQKAEPAQALKTSRLENIKKADISLQHSNDSTNPIHYSDVVIAQNIVFDPLQEEGGLSAAHTTAKPKDTIIKQSAHVNLNEDNAVKALANHQTNNSSDNIKGIIKDRSQNKKIDDDLDKSVDDIGKLFADIDSMLFINNSSKKAPQPKNTTAEKQGGKPAQSTPEEKVLPETLNEEKVAGDALLTDKATANEDISTENVKNILKNIVENNLSVTDDIDFSLPTRSVKQEKTTKPQPTKNDADDLFADDFFNLDIPKSSQNKQSIELTEANKIDDVVNNAQEENLFAVETADSDDATAPIDNAQSTASGLFTEMENEGIADTESLLADENVTDNDADLFSQPTSEELLFETTEDIEEKATAPETLLASKEPATALIQPEQTTIADLKMSAPVAALLEDALDEKQLQSIINAQSNSKKTKTHALGSNTAENQQEKLLPSSVNTNKLNALTNQQVPTLQQAPTTSTKVFEHAKQITRQGFMVAGLPMLISFDAGSQLTEIPEITRLPKVPDWFLGYANLMGKLTPVFDLASFLNLENSSKDENTGFKLQKSYLLVLRQNDDAAGIIIDGLPKRFSWSASKSVPINTAPESLIPMLSKAYELGNTIWFDLDVDALLASLEEKIHL